jgi:DNA-binding transcriptional LysR family regulator
VDKLRSRQIYCQVIKEGSFSAVAKKLKISKVMVSRAVSELEEDLAVRLLNRTTRKMSPTEEGMAYFERCQVLLDDFDVLDKSVREKHQTAKGLLRISIPSEAFSKNNLMPPIFDFMQLYPDVEFDIHAGDRYVDIVDDGFDVVIRIGDLSDSSHIARKLGEMNLIICATPEYLKKHEPIIKPEDLNQHSLLVDTVYRSGRSWLFKKENQSTSIKLNSHFKVNSPIIISEAIKNDLGIGMCPSFVIQNELKSGEFVSVLDDWELMRGGVYAIYSHRRYLSTKVSLFVEHLIKHFQIS